MAEVYITKTANFFPNSPVSNDEMEDYLGMIDGKPSKSRRIVLRNNGIVNRYYAIDKAGNVTHSNAEMSAQALRKLFDNDPEQIKSIELLSCGTSSADQLMPSHAVMVHGLLPEMDSVEVVSPAGVCCAGMHSLKYAYMAVKLGDVNNAVATGSELFAPLLRANTFEEEAQKLKSLQENPYIGFEKEFLRWMLSDGAGALYLSNTKNENELNLKIDWIEGVSYANKIEPCMYMGCEKLENGSLKSFKTMTPEELIGGSALSIKQDVKLLSQHIVSFGYDKLKDIFDKKGITIEEVDHFLPHISSNFFRSKIADILVEHGMGVPEEKWFINLYTVGNVGAASIYLMIDELYHSGKLKKGDKILLVVPESSRFSYSFGLLTVC
ncbi:MAG: beta-ketoacyl-ACP synthase III [Cyclobacteriaceae bacterium]|nr:beta-ketoacyl-ACP synthase III [Cyclobacteriaceae bacterium]